MRAMGGPWYQPILHLLDGGDQESGTAGSAESTRSAWVERRRASATQPQPIAPRATAGLVIGESPSFPRCHGRSLFAVRREISQGNSICGSSIVGSTDSLPPLIKGDDGDRKG